jgi:hypothetical protein
VSGTYKPPTVSAPTRNPYGPISTTVVVEDLSDSVPDAVEGEIAVSAYGYSWSQYPDDGPINNNVEAPHPYGRQDIIHRSDGQESAVPHKAIAACDRVAGAFIPSPSSSVSAPPHSAAGGFPNAPQGARVNSAPSTPAAPLNQQLKENDENMIQSVTF